MKLSLFLIIVLVFSLVFTAGPVASASPIVSEVPLALDVSSENEGSSDVSLEKFPEELLAQVLIKDRDLIAKASTDFERAVALLCDDGKVWYSKAGDWSLRKEVKKGGVVPALLLGLSYAHAVSSGEKLDSISVKRVTRQNAETLLRAFLRFSNKLSKLDKFRFAALKKSGECGFKTDAKLAFVIQEALLKMNSARQVRLVATGGVSEKDRSLYDFEGYFLLGPKSEMSFPFLSSSISAKYDLAGKTPYFFLKSGERTKLAPKSFGKIDAKFYSFKVFEKFDFGRKKFFYVFVTSDPIYSGGLKGKTVVVEAGHYMAYFDPKSAFADSGSVWGNLVEREVNKLIKSKLVPLLLKKGVRILPDPKRDEPGNVRMGGKYNDLKWDVGWKPLVRWVRYKHEKGVSVDAFVSIHHNVLDPTKKYDFTEAYYGGKSIGLSRSLQKEITKAIGSGTSYRSPLLTTESNPRTEYANDLPTSIPTTLVEVQFTRTVYENVQANKYTLDDYANKAAKGFVAGLSKYFLGEFWPERPVFDP